NGSQYVMFEYSSPADNGSTGDPVASDMPFNGNSNNESPTSSPPAQDPSSQNAYENSLFIGDGIQ
ncbi:hypothetical protein LPJ59_006142, partial [Coemansia sp. RSA 2399]